jgi:N-methylhydantoinase B
MRHNDVLDISGLSELRGVSEERRHWRIGALTTWTDLIRADLPPLFDGIKRAAREVGGVQIQNRGTLAGNICTASPAGDGIPNLLVLNAAIELASERGSRIVPAAEFIDGYRHTACRPDELVVAVLVPKPRREASSGFLKLGARRYLVISIVMVAGVVETDRGGLIQSIRLAVGACSAVPQRLSTLEAVLKHQPVVSASNFVRVEHFAHLSPIDDIRASADYRQHAAATLIHDLLDELAMQDQRRAA